MKPTPELTRRMAAVVAVTGTNAAGTAFAAAAGLDLDQRRQAELPLDFTYWRADRWDVESRWKPHVAKELCLGSNPWYPHSLYLDCRTECIARNACQTLRRQFPGKSYRYRPSRWVDAKGNRFSEPS